jgi:hypothetical protein
MVAVMVDNPCSLVAELAAPRSDLAVTGWVDATHPDAVRALGFAHRAFFLPHAGPEPARMTPFADRDIDVFFAGSLEEPLERGAWRDAHPNVPSAVSEAIFDTVELIEASGKPVLPAFLDMLTHRQVAPAQLTREAFAALVTLVLKIAEAKRRLEILQALPESLRVAVAADYLPNALRDRPNLRYLDYIDDFDRIRALMERARIVLNTTMKFPAGSHERIWYAMAAGAVVLTDYSAFMKCDFCDGESILYLPQKHIEPRNLAPVAETIADTTKLARMAQSALTNYQRRHTWAKRAPLLIEAMRAA